MHPLSSAELLEAWEQGLSENACGRTVALLSLACPEISAEEVQSLSVGERDARLLKLREWTFGPSLLSIAKCPVCRESLEWATHVSGLNFEPVQESSTAHFSVECDQYVARFRLPNIGDLTAISQCQDSETARRLLLGRCLIGARLGTEEIRVESLPIEVTNAVVKRMTEVDPHGNVEIDLSCPACNHKWRACFDIESFFWTEINAWARRILGEIHILASAYGWREADILNLSPQRRQLYLNLVTE